MTSQLTNLIRRLRAGGTRTRGHVARGLSRDPLESAAAIAVVPQSTEQMQYVETDFRDYVTNNFLKKCLDSGTDVFCQECHFDLTDSIAEDVMITLDQHQYDYVVIATNSKRMQLVIDGVGIVTVRSSSSSTWVDVLGASELIEQVLDVLTNKYDEITTGIEWIVGDNSGSVTVPLRAPGGIVDSSYPFIEEGVDQFVTDFLQSSENILLLIGAPGTGKSNFIKHIIARSKSNALITYDPEVMKKDVIFATFIEGDYGSLIMEDADAFLGARSEGNQMMAKFLNVGDGIVSMRGKKLIFSTNLEKLDDIDPALLRPGRCFAVVQFRKMTFSEAKRFISDHNIVGWTPTPGEKYSLAELYNHTKQIRQATAKRSIGFC